MVLGGVEETCFSSRAKSWQRGVILSDQDFPNFVQAPRMSMFVAVVTRFICILAN
jgi:hypothetical protein